MIKLHDKTRIRNIENERNEKEQEIARIKRVSMTQLRDSQSQVQSVRSTDAVGRMYTVHPKNDECFYFVFINKSINCWINTSTGTTVLSRYSIAIK